MFDFTLPTHRRGFLGRVAAGAAALGLGSLATPLAAAEPRTAGADPAFEAWLNKITGKRKMVFDAPGPHEGLPLIWPRVFLNTANETYGTTDADNSAVVVLRHSGIVWAMKDAMWAKYKLGEATKVTDGATNAPAVRNTFAGMKPGDFPIPGVGIDELLAKGVLIGVCNVALTFLAGQIGKGMGMDGAAIKQEWVANLFAGVQIVPSGVLAVNRTQEKGCVYCFAG